MGPAFGEETLLKIAHAYESATDRHTRTARRYCSTYNDYNPLTFHVEQW